MTVESARARLEGAERILVLTGAGISAESGVPTFRGEAGLWRSHRPEELATPGAFARDPRLVWEWYAWRREVVTDCRPNAAHRAVARATLARPGVRIVTQNVDGLHERAVREELAGGDRDGLETAELPEGLRPVELHGSLFRVRCSGCRRRRPHRGPIDASDHETLPRCPECGELLRPDVVWFGEALDPAVLQTAFDLARRADVCLVVGTSSVVEPAASLPRVAAAGGAAVVEVNPEATPLTPLADLGLRGTAGELLPALLGE